MEAEAIGEKHTCVAFQGMHEFDFGMRGHQSKRVPGGSGAENKRLGVGKRTDPCPFSNLGAQCLSKVVIVHSKEHPHRTSCLAMCHNIDR